MGGFWFTSSQGMRHTALAKGVSYGFKAPVSMLMVPYFLHEFGKLKFILVVRDGRDIAFSGVCEMRVCFASYSLFPTPSFPSRTAQVC